MLLPFHDVLPLILENPELDQTTLLHCCLVSRAFSHAASKVLYRKIVLSPRFQPVLDLKDSPNSPQYNILHSSSRPHYALHVSELVVGGFLSERPPPRNPLGGLLSAAVHAYINLRFVTLTPMTFHPDVFTDVLRALKDVQSDRKKLQRLTVNASCTDANRAPLLVGIQGLRELGLHDPTRAVLQLLPAWLDRLSPTLVALHLRGNCGSITPGVLRSFLPQIQHIRTLSLGLSYSLTDEDVFTFLGQLPHLESVHLRYYLQLRSPAKIPPLSKLRSFTVRYKCVQNREDTNRICVWVRRAIACSPLEHLRMICDHPDDGSSPRSGPNVSFDSLVRHLSAKHPSTLRSLHMHPAFVGPDALRSLCEHCVGLEELSVSLGIRSLWVFKDLVPNLKNLHTARFDVRNIKLGKLAQEIPKAAEMIENLGTSALRRFSVNDVHWEGSWVSVSPSDVKWIVQDMAHV